MKKYYDYKIESHFHCKFDGELMEEIGRVAYRVGYGVGIILKCPTKHLMVKFENGEKKWIEL